MKFTMLFSSAFALCALPISVIAETGPPLAFDTQLNPVTGERSVEQIVLKHGGDVQTYRIDALLNIAEDIPGLALSFPEPLRNAPGPDFVVAELGLPKGAQSNGGPGGQHQMPIASPCLFPTGNA
ncbi:hypothetical protein [Leptothoe spongobia]|uniref:Gingipain propeptide domain-containing protein n=1 Tax=Leptothoe spongobia TAU-MAC 1115 TaxID=1967444 RepID=A0A947GKI0_9CYAN|nr:hypothetical protein [Leptothoe spongobia]MBT9317815.1 hypothetical protein [Leptothoe spongobia TAU-MAC 1115]